MLILKKKHDLVVKVLEIKVADMAEVNVNRLMKIDQLQKDLKLESDIRKNYAENFEMLEKVKEDLENRNSGLHTQLIAEEAKNSKLREELEEAKKLVQDMENKVEEYRAANVAIGKTYNNINNKLWCNEESARQLRNLAQDIREADTFKKMYIAKYLDEISLRVGGGEKIKFVEVKKTEDETEAVG